MITVDIWQYVGEFSTRKLYITVYRTTFDDTTIKYDFHTTDLSPIMWPELQLRLKPFLETIDF